MLFGDTASGPGAPGERVGHASAQGPRPSQQDAAAIAGDRFAVFDGLGGHTGGAEAAASAAEMFAATSDRSFADAVAACSDAVRKVQASDVRLRSAATTIAAVQVEARRLMLAWAGDSRVYLYRSRRRRGERLVQLTEDHNHDRHVLARCLGYGNVPPALGEVTRNKGDIVVLTTDGLHEFLPEGAMEKLIAANKKSGAQAVADALLTAALAFPTEDNATVLVVDCGA